MSEATSKLLDLAKSFDDRIKKIYQEIERLENRIQTLNLEVADLVVQDTDLKDLIRLAKKLEVKIGNSWSDIGPSIDCHNS